MLRTKLSFLSRAFLTVLVCIVTGSGQTFKDETIFTAVPVALRARFIERLSLYVEYSLKGRNEKLLELYDEETLCSLCKGKSQCTKDCMPPMRLQVPEGFNSALVEFNPTEIKPYKVGNSDYCIEVEQKERVSWKGKAPHIVKSKVRLFAVYQNGDWRFSLVSIDGMIYL
jgi:hypothetical protein